jgi:hypothetical protein
MQLPLRERGQGVAAGVVQSVELPLHVEEGDGQVAHLHPRGVALRDRLRGADPQPSPHQLGWTESAPERESWSRAERTEPLASSRSPPSGKKSTTSAKNPSTTSRLASSRVIPRDWQ